MGLFDQGLPELQKARDLDPLSLIINTNLGLNYYWARQYDRALEHLERALELEPNFSRAHLHLVCVTSGKGCTGQRLPNSRRLDPSAKTHGLWPVSVNVTLPSARERRLKIFWNNCSSCRAGSLCRPRPIAVVYAGFEDGADQTMEWLEKAYEERFRLLIYLKIWPIFDHLRGDARFVRLLRRIGFANEGATTA